MVADKGNKKLGASVLKDISQIAVAQLHREPRYWLRTIISSSVSSDLTARRERR
jgi:hypothetical protein